MHQLVTIVVLMALIGICIAQVNFSTDWGKRSLNPSSGSSNNNCKVSLDTIMLVYKLIQVSHFNQLLLVNSLTASKLSDGVIYCHITTFS